MIDIDYKPGKHFEDGFGNKWFCYAYSNNFYLIVLIGTHDGKAPTFSPFNQARVDNFTMLSRFDEKYDIVKDLGFYSWPGDDRVSVSKKRIEDLEKTVETLSTERDFINRRYGGYVPGR